MNVTRGETAVRCLLLRCPNCGAGGQLRNWFRLKPACPECGLQRPREDGFTLGTTSIGYVLAFLLVVLPVCVLVVRDALSVWVGVVVAIAGSVALSVGLYPVFLGWILLIYYAARVDELPANRRKDP